VVRLTKVSLRELRIELFERDAGQLLETFHHRRLTFQPHDCVDDRRELVAEFKGH
jgi:hypothetical protein